MSSDSDNFTQKIQNIWNQNAEFWDGIIGDTGNRFHRTVVEPATLKLLAPVAVSPYSRSLAATVPLLVLGH